MGPSTAWRLVFVMVLGFGIVCGGGGVWWWVSAGRTVYRCDGTELAAFRGGRRVVSVNCREVKELNLVPAMTAGELFWNILMEVPTLLVGVEKGHARSKGGRTLVEFPPILIWGEKALADAEAALRVAVGIGGESVEHV